MYMLHIWDYNKIYPLSHLKHLHKARDAAHRKSMPPYPIYSTFFLGNYGYVSFINIKHAPFILLFTKEDCYPNHVYFMKVKPRQNHSSVMFLLVQLHNRILYSSSQINLVNCSALVSLLLQIK